jgi:hypothetical protein
MKINLRNQLFGSLLAACAGVGAIFFVSCNKPEPEKNTRLPDVAVASTDTRKSSKTDVQGLVGRWLRPDVGYTLEIRKVAADGTLDIIYSAPRPVEVSKATATQEAGRVKVFIELKDPSLAGCTYTMTFDPQAERLNGVYFQAALRESYEIFFVRE